MGVWGRKSPEASDISKNQIKWKPDIYFVKRKLHLKESDKMEVDIHSLKRKLHLFFFKAYVVKL